jgi:hypothetical protein
MKSKANYIGLNQRIPFEVLDTAIQVYLELGSIERELILEKMKEFTAGENRARKASSYVMQILKRQDRILKELRNAISGISYSNLKMDDRKALCLCLISLTYPITYDLLVALAQGFKVQSFINKKFISEKVMAIYGSNRTVEIAIDALIPIIIELQTIRREKISIYSLGTKLRISNKFISELIIFSDIKLSGSKSILIDDLSFRPWYSYFQILDLESMSIKRLLKKKDSAVGKGYLTI